MLVAEPRPTRRARRAAAPRRHVALAVRRRQRGACSQLALHLDAVHEPCAWRLIKHGSVYRGGWLNRASGGNSVRAVSVSRTIWAIFLILVVFVALVYLASQTLR